MKPISKYFEDFLKNYQKETDLVKRVELIWDSGETYFDSRKIELKEIIEKEIVRCKSENYLDGEVVLRLLHVQIIFDGSNIINMLNEYEFVRQNIERINNNLIRGFAYMFLGISNSYQGNYAMAFDCALMSKKCYVGNEDSRHYGWGGL